MGSTSDRFFGSSQRPDRLWGPTGRKGYQSFGPQGRVSVSWTHIPIWCCGYECVDVAALPRTFWLVSYEQGQLRSYRHLLLGNFASLPSSDTFSFLNHLFSLLEGTVQRNLIKYLNIQNFHVKVTPRGCIAWSWITRFPIVWSPRVRLHDRIPQNFPGSEAARNVYSCSWIWSRPACKTELSLWRKVSSTVIREYEIRCYTVVVVKASMRNKLY